MTKSTSSADACEFNPGTKKNNPRAPQNNPACTPRNSLHVSVVTKSIPVLKTITKTCNARHAKQACYHYYSVIKNNPASSWDYFTCTDGQARVDGTATDSWEKQHPKNAWRDYLPKAFTNTAGVVSCQRDEYPPGFFHKKGNPQVIRWLPQKDNSRGGNLWAGFCSKNDGGYKNGQLLKESIPKKLLGDELNLKLLDLSPNPVVRTKRGADGKATTMSQYEAKFTRAVFHIKFDWVGRPAPGPANDWYLSQNPCWPKAVATDDPGYNLNTDDNWYMTAGTPAQQAARLAQKALYAGAIPAALAQTAVKPKRRAVDTGDNFDLSARDFEILDDGYGLRNANFSRRLDDGEIEVIQCQTSNCEQELQLLSPEEIAAIIPAPVEKKSVLPEANVVVPTGTPASFDVPAEKRGEISPQLPTATGSL